jgi:hypothetical protein
MPILFGFSTSTLKRFSMTMTNVSKGIIIHPYSYGLYHPFMVKRGMVDYCFTNKSEDDPLILGCSPPLPDIQLLAQQIGTSLSLQEDQLQMLRILPGFTQLGHLGAKRYKKCGPKRIKKDPSLVTRVKTTPQ